MNRVGVCSVLCAVILIGCAQQQQKVGEKSGSSQGEFSQGRYGPYRVAMEELEAEVRELCVQEDLQPHFHKSPCFPNEATLEQLTDSSKISGEEKIALSKLKVALSDMAAKYATVHRQYDPRSGNAIAQLIERQGASYNKIVIDFYEGRISRGEFNKRRLDQSNKDYEEFQKVTQGS